jgi:hypothetical protein
MAVNAEGTRLYVALAGSDQIAVVDTRGGKVLRHLSDANPAGPSEGSTPNALALSKDGSKLLVAEADNNAVAVFYVAETDRFAGLAGRIPTDWYPTAVVEAGGKLLVLSGKGHGSHANPDGPVPGERRRNRQAYDLGQLNGTLRTFWQEDALSHLVEYSRRVAAANHWEDLRSSKKYPPFKHVIYIIKENRTYDQVFGDLKEGDGDLGLVFFGEKVTPNHHSLALRFGLFDRFFTNAEVSSQGHMWSTAAYVTDYNEKTVHSYSDRRENTDDEEADDPANGFLWNLAKKKGVSFRDYGEMVSREKGPGREAMERRGLAGDVNLDYAPFNMAIPDQARADVWLAEFQKFVEKKELPQLEILHLPSDHTAGGKVGFRTPRAMVADNDLALGRIVEAVTKSRFWKDTVIFVLEDDSQNGPDHVDSHRSPALVISAYNRAGTNHRFANTTDVVAAIEDILGLDRMSKYDYFSRSLADVFSDTQDLSPWTSVGAQVDLKEMNAAGETARMSEGSDFSAADLVDDDLFNRILWRMVKGGEVFPEVRAAAPVHVLAMSW